MDKYKRKIDAANGEDDWNEARNVLVNCFQKYPLYQYMEPDDTKRPEFLRRYMEANYDVAVRQGNGFLIVMRIEEEGESNKEKSGKIVGALLFVVPAEDGIGWAVKEDTLYWEAYERFKIADVSDGCLRRLKEYEAWEHKNVTRKLWRAGMPLWNALFCALDAKYCPKGCGTLSYEETIRLMCSQRPKKCEKRPEIPPQPCTTQDSGDPGFLERLKNLAGLSNVHNPPSKAEGNENDHQKENEKASTSPKYMRLLHGLSMLHHRPMPCSFQPDNNTSQSCTGQAATGTYNRNEPNKSNSMPLRRLPPRGVHVVQSVTGENQGGGEGPRGSTEISLPSEIFERADMLNSGNPPLITAISHSRLSAHFHAKNGFEQVAQIPYFPEGREGSPFGVHVLFMDPFRTGNVGKLKNAMAEQPDQMPTMQNTTSILSHAGPPISSGVVGCPT